MSCFALYGQTWTGVTSSDWNTPSNWNTGAVPTATGLVVINNAAAPNQPVLDSNRSIRDLTISAGILDLSGFLLTVTRNFRSTGGSINTGSIAANDFTQMENTTFNGAITLSKTGSGDDDVNGGNTFNGPTTVILADNNRFRFAAVNGDTFNDVVTFQNNNVNFLDVAYAGNSTFAATITVNNLNAGGEVRFGEGGGSSILNSGGVVTTNFSVGNILEFNNFTQVQNAPNGSFGVATFNAINSSFQGDLTITATTAINFTGPNSFYRNATFSAPSIAMTVAGNNFATLGGIARFTKTGNATNDWIGGNTFGTLEITNSGNGRLRLANVNGDTFLGTSIFTNTGTNAVDISFSGTNTFAASITINNTNANGIVGFGRGNGTSNLVTGGLLTTNFSVGNTLDIQDFIQLENVPNGSFGVNTFNSTSSSFQGDFQVIANTIVNFVGANTFARNSTFSAPSLTAVAGNSFANLGGTATFTKTGNATNNWTGGNTFGTLVFTNNSNGGVRLANTTGDTFLSTSIFSNNGTSSFDIAFNGLNTFAQTITINNTNASGIIGFGRGNGTSSLANGALTTTNFNVGNTLDIQDFTQVANAPNGSFVVNTFNSTNSSFQGDFQVTGNTLVNFVGANTFARNATFTAPSLAANGGNSFSTLGGTTTFTKTGTATNTWNGGNTFGRVVFNNNSNGSVRLANTTGDIFLSTSTFSNNGTNYFDISYNGTNTFAESITINNTNAAGIIGFGRASGTTNLVTGGLLTTDFSVGNTLDIHFFTQVQNIANGTFGVGIFNSTSSSFQGDFQVTATNSVNFIGANIFARNSTFNAPSLTANGANFFATLGGTANFIKTGGTGNNWNGGNTFGIANFSNNSTGSWRLANTIGDTFLENVSFVKTGSGVIEPAYNGTNSFRGNISTVGSNASLLFSEGNGTVIIDGNRAQVWDGDASQFPIAELVQMNTTGTLTLNVPLRIDQTLTFTSGNINTTTTNVLTFIDNATVASTSDASHVNGPVLKIGNDNFAFPVGDAGFYAPITLAGGGVVGDQYRAQYFQVSPVNIPTDTVSKDPTIGLMNQSEYWSLERAGTAARGVTLSYNASRTSPIIDHTELVSIRYDNTTWRDIGGIVSGTAASGTITAGTTTNNEPLYSIGSSFRILPVELLTFTAEITDTKEVLIKWTTASEKNNSHFILEKSPDGAAWETFSIVAGSGDSLEEIDYQVLDGHPSLGRQYYRLIQVDFDGDSEIFQTIAISLQPENSPNLDVKVFPNPSQGKIYLQSRNFNLNDMNVEILDLTGRTVIKTSNLKNTKGVFDLSSLPKGMYILKLYSTKEVWTKKIILE